MSSIFPSRQLSELGGLRASDNTIWSDIDMSFNINPNTRSFGVKRNIEAIRQHILLLFIDEGPTPFDIDKNSNILDLLFEQWNPHTKSVLEEQIRIQIETFESRINLLETILNFDENRRELNVRIVYEYREERGEIDFKVLIDRVQ